MSATIVTPSARSRMQRWRPMVGIVAAVLIAFIASLFLPTVGTVNLPFSIKNPRPEGAQAIARVLEAQGFDVKETFSAREALSLMRHDAKREATLIIIQPGEMHPEVDEAVAQLPRVVAFGMPYVEALKTLPNMDVSYGSVSSGSAPAGPTTSQTATIANAISIPNTVQAIEPLDSQWQPAFKVSHKDETDAYLFAERLDGGTYRAVLSSPVHLTNHIVGLHGNAALIMNAVSAHATLPVKERGPLVFFHPMIDDDMTDKASPLPPWGHAMGMLVLISLIVLGVSRGRRLGRFVYEEVPSYIPSAETIAGKGRLLLHNGQVDHIAAQLRRDTARRLARQLALPPTAPADALSSALIHAGARPESVSWLWAPIPTTRNDLQEVADRLSALEKEISL